MNEEQKAAMTALKTAFEEFKKTNDERLSAVEKNGKSDPLLDEKLEKCNSEISRLQGVIDGMNVASNRVQLVGAKGEVKTLSADEIAYTKAMEGYLRKGRGHEDGSLLELQKKAMISGSDPDGGYMLAPAAVGPIIHRVYESTPMRMYATVQTISSDKLEGGLDLDEASSGWVGETTPRSETGTPKTGGYSIPVQEIYAQPKVSQRLLDDAAVNVEQWLADKVSDRFARQENRAFAVGDGALKPRGLFSYPTSAQADKDRPWQVCQHILTGSAGAFGANGGDRLIDLVYSLKADYRAGAAFMTPRLVLAEARKIKDDEGRYIWQPGLQAGAPSTLLGYPVAEAEDAPAMANNSLSLAFGNYKEAYIIVDRIGIRVIRDGITVKGWVLFYTTKRVGGDVVNFEAVKFLKFGA